MARKKRKAKFAGRKQSVPGLVGLALSIVCIVALFAILSASYKGAGSLSMYIGELGLLIGIIDIVALVLCIKGLRDEDAFKVFPLIGTIVGGVGVLSYIGIYVLGILY